MVERTDLLIGVRMWQYGSEWERPRPDAEWLGYPAGLKFQPGMSVFYGKNGAGKSTLLDSIKCALTGVRSTLPIELYTRLPEAESPDAGNWPVLPMKTGLGTAEMAWDWNDLLDAAQHDWSARCEGYEGLAEIAVQSGALALIPTGSHHSPEWDVWLAVDPTRAEMKPWADATRERISTFREAFERWARTEDDDDYATYSEYYWELGRDPLFSLAWTRPANRYGHRWEYLDDICNRWEELRIPTEPQDGLPVPIARLATTRRLHWPRTLFEVGNEVLEPMLNFARLVKRYGGSETDADSIAERTNEIVADAQEYYALLLPDCPRLTARGLEPLTWRQRPDGPWRASRDFRAARPLSELSAAEGRWATFSAMLSTGLQGPPITDFTRGDGYEPERISDNAPTVVILDEPELHLHRSAESYLAEGLQSLARDSVEYMFVATHAPDLLNLSTANLYWVSDGSVKEFTGAALDNLDALGLRPSDLLGITRVVLLVEGHHDQLVLKELIGDRLRRTNTYILPLGGGSRLEGAVDSDILFDFTDAHVIGLLDNLDPYLARDIYLKAERLLLEAGRPAAVDFINDALKGNKKSEFIYLKKWLTRAITQEGFPYSRFTAYGLTKADIVEYLPVKHFTPKAKSWEELRTKHREQRSSGQTRIGDFKVWVAKTYATDFDDDRIINAINTMDYVPEDFIRLAQECDRVGKSPTNEVGV